MKTLFTLSLILLFLPLTTHAQYCMNVGPSSDMDSNVEQVILNGSSGGINYSGCPGIMGIDDRFNFTNVGLSAGNNYTAFILFGTCGGDYAGAGQAWIDFNRNGTFEQSETIATWQGTPPGTLTGYNFNVPSGAQSGITRMRVMQHEGTSLPLDPCASFTWGSVTDFKVTLLNGVNCSGYDGDDISDAIPVTTYPYRDTNSTYICYSSFSQVYNSPDVYYMAILDTLKDSLRVSLCGSDFDTHLAIQNTNGDVIYYNDDYCGAQSEILFPTTGLDTVYIIVEGWDTARGTYFLFIDNDYETVDVSVKQIETNDAFVTVSPNPTTGHIRIQGILPERTHIFNIAGKEVLPNQKQSDELDLSDLPAGVYLLLMEYEDKIYRKKILKQ